MPPVKRAPIVAPPTSNRVPFGSPALYSGGGGIPEGDYALTFTVENFQATRQDGTSAGPSRLGVRVEAWPIAVSNGAAQLREDEPLSQFYSMGSKADQSFTPDPETGKGIVPIPGGPASTLPDSTNWAILRKSFEDSGLGAGIFVDTLEVLDGVWVHMQQVDEPESRKGFKSQAATGEAAEAQVNQGPRKIAVVTQIHEGGSPWEGGGGVPTTKVNGKAAVTPAAKPVVAGRAKPTTALAPPPVVEAATEDEGDIETAAVNAVGSVLALPIYANGTTKLILRAKTFGALNPSNPAMAQLVTSTYFSSDEVLNGLLGALGYKVVGANIVVA